MRGDTLKRNTEKAKYLAAVVPITGDDAGFQVPLFRSNIASDFFVQKCVDGVVSGFVPVEVNERFREVDQSLRLTCSLGDFQVFAYLLSSGGLIAGTIPQLRGRLAIERSLVQFEDACLALQISLILGDEDATESARRIVCAHGDANYSPFSSRMYKSSIARQVAWSHIENSISDADKKRRFRENLSAFHYFVSEDGIVRFEQLSDAITLDPEILQHAKDVAQSRIREAFESITDDEFGREHSEVILRQLKNLSKAPRQETRLALLIQLILESPEQAFKIMRLYVDRGQFANEMIAILSEVFSMPSFKLNRSEIEAAIASLVPTFYRRAYYGNRGVLLAKLAEHLGPYRLIQQAVRRRFESSRSREVLVQSEEIREALNRRRKF